jgi:hypothetical protein
LKSESSNNLTGDNKGWGGSDRIQKNYFNFGILLNFSIDVGAANGLDGNFVPFASSLRPLRPGFCVAGSAEKCGGAMSFEVPG